jgi:hypothetical protein
MTFICIWLVSIPLIAFFFNRAIEDKEIRNRETFDRLKARVLEEEPDWKTRVKKF